MEWRHLRLKTLETEASFFFNCLCLIRIQQFILSGLWINICWSSERMHYTSECVAFLNRVGFRAWPGNNCTFYWHISSSVVLRNAAETSLLSSRSLIHFPRSQQINSNTENWGCFLHIDCLKLLLPDPAILNLCLLCSQGKRFSLVLTHTLSCLQYHSSCVCSKNLVYFFFVSDFIVFSGCFF